MLFLLTLDSPAMDAKFRQQWCDAATVVGRRRVPNWTAVLRRELGLGLLSFSYFCPY